jgi:thymidylate synthase
MIRFQRNTTDTWLSLLDSIMTHGRKVSPRGQDTLEILSCTSEVDMNAPIVSSFVRNINTKFLFGEAWWILSGSNRVSDIMPYLKNIAQFSDDGITFNGAYGPKVIDQLPYALKCLVDDECSRQAVISIWREKPASSKDIPCTLSLQFFIRDGKLHTQANMRSSDAWLGWVYDVFNFSMISAWLAVALRRHEKYKALTLGELYLTAGSQHLYMRNKDKAVEALDIIFENHVDVNPIKLSWYTHPEELVTDLRLAANGAPGSRIISMVENMRSPK